ncbi:MAG: helix-turn-helix transcriptional regulator [Acidimicrobiia bacterium]
MTQSSTQRQARALGDPTRHRIFRYLADSSQAVGVGELTDLLGLNHNAIRQHLSILTEAGLVTRETARAQGKGRPRLMFSVHPSADERWGVGGPYQRLSLMLIEMLKTGDSPVEVGRRAAPDIEVPTDRGAHAIEGLARAMARGGFDPVLVGEGGRTEFALRHCPFADSAAVDPETVCALHLGLAQGLAEQIQGVVVDELEPHDPHDAGCRLRFHVTERPTL